jgi:hypothetical protein
MLGRWAVSTLKEDLGPLAATWSPGVLDSGQRPADSGHLAGLESWGLARTGKCTLHTHTAHSTRTAPQQSGPEGDGRWVELHGRRQGGG